MYFCYFVIMFPFKRAGFFIWTILHYCQPNITCANFNRKWWNGSWIRKIIFVNAFLLYRLYKHLPLKRTWSFIWKKNEFSSLKNALCLIWLRLTQWFMGRRMEGQRITGYQKSSLDFVISGDLKIETLWQNI